MRFVHDIAVLLFIAIISGCTTTKINDQVIKAPVDQVVEEKINHIREDKKELEKRLEDVQEPKPNLTEDQSSSKLAEGELPANEEQVQAEAQAGSDQTNQIQKVALFAPANHKDNYKTMLDAAQMAIFDLKEEVNIDLRIVNADKPIEELEEDIIGLADDGVKWIIGPQSSDTTRFTYNFFLKNDTTTILLSMVNNDSCADLERYYSIATPVQSQISVMLEKWKEEGKNNNSKSEDIILAILPKNMKLYENFDKVLYYDSDPKQAILDITRAITFIKKLPPYSRLGIVLPEGGWRIKRLTAELRSMHHTTIMVASGSNLNITDSGNRERSMGETNSIWYTEIKIRPEFRERFYKNYGYYPSDLATYVYDAIILMSQNITNKKLLGASEFSLRGCDLERVLGIIKKEHKV